MPTLEDKRESHFDRGNPGLFSESVRRTLDCNPAGHRASRSRRVLNIEDDGLQEQLNTEDARQGGKYHRPDRGCNAGHRMADPLIGAEQYAESQE